MRSIKSFLRKTRRNSRSSSVSPTSSISTAAKSRVSTISSSQSGTTSSYTVTAPFERYSPPNAYGSARALPYHPHLVEPESNLLRGPESNRRLEVLLHLLFPAGMDYPMILKQDPPIIVSEPFPAGAETWLLIAESLYFSDRRAHPFGSRCGIGSSNGVPAI